MTLFMVCLLPHTYASSLNWFSLSLLGKKRKKKREQQQQQQQKTIEIKESRWIKMFNFNLIDLIIQKSKHVDSKRGTTDVYWEQAFYTH